MARSATTGTTLQAGQRAQDLSSPISSTTSPRHHRLPAGQLRHHRMATTRTVTPPARPACASISRASPRCLARRSMAAEKIFFGSIGETHFVNGVAAPPTPDARWNNAPFRQFRRMRKVRRMPRTPTRRLRGGITRRSAPYIIHPADRRLQSLWLYPDHAAGIPTARDGYTADIFVLGKCSRRLAGAAVNTSSGSLYWNLEYIVIAGTPRPVVLEDPGIPAVLPTLGRNAYAYLNQLDPTALNQVQAANNRSATTGTSNAATSRPVGREPVRRLHRDQEGVEPAGPAVHRAGHRHLERHGRRARPLRPGLEMGCVLPVRRHRQQLHGVQRRHQPRASTSPWTRSSTTAWVRPPMASRCAASSRDGVPVLDTTGLPMSDAEGLRTLAADCKPLNIFGASSLALAWPEHDPGAAGPAAARGAGLRLQGQLLGGHQQPADPVLQHLRHAVAGLGGSADRRHRLRIQRGQGRQQGHARLVLPAVGPVRLAGFLRRQDPHRRRASPS